MASIAASTKKVEESNKRIATTDNLKRLVRYYEWSANFMKGLGGMRAACKPYLDQAARAKKVLSLRHTDAAMASTVEEDIFNNEISKMKDSMDARVSFRIPPVVIEVNGDTLTITHPAILDDQSDLTPKSLVLLGINHINLSDGAGRTVNQDDKIIEVRNRRGQSDMSEEEKDEQWWSLIESEYGKAVADHTRKVVNGEIPLMAEGPRGYATMRRVYFGRETRQARNQVSAAFRLAVQTIEAKAEARTANTPAA